MNKKLKEQGFTLIEVLVAMAILSVVSVCFLGGLTTSSKAAMTNDQIDTGRAIAQAQMESVKGQTYLPSGTYAELADLDTQYPGYSVDINAVNAVDRDALIQTVTVVVSYNGKVITQLQDCKAKR